MAPLYTAMGRAYFDQPKGSGMRERLGSLDHIRSILDDAGLPTSYAEAADDTDWDAEIVPLDGSDAHPPVRSGPYLMEKFRSTGA